MLWHWITPQQGDVATKKKADQLLRLSGSSGLALPSRSGLAPRDLRRTGAVSIRPIELLPVGGPVTLAFLYCRRCTWEIDQVQFDQPPWSAQRLASGDRYRCPGCSGRVDWHIHGPTWRPSYREHAAAP